MMRYFETEKKIYEYFRRKAVPMLRFSMGIIFIWYGMLKIVGESPANQLVLHALPWFQDHSVIIMIGLWEILIGLLLFSKITLRYGLILMFLHFPGTFLPLFTQPSACFTTIPFGLTLEGQYIFKNLVLISAALVLLSELRGESV